MAELMDDCGFEAILTQVVNHNIDNPDSRFGWFSPSLFFCAMYELSAWFVSTHE